VKIIAPKDTSKAFNETNSKEIYDINKLNENSLREAQKYVSFRKTEIPMNE